MQQNELIDKIWSAFRFTSIEKIYVGDESSGEQEYAEAAKFFKTHTREQLAEIPSLIPLIWANWDLISAAAWHHFLPAYLIASLKEDSSALREHVLLGLDPGEPNHHLVDVFLDKVELITVSQREVIAEWFDMIAQFVNDENKQHASFERTSEFWHNEQGIRQLMDSFKPDPDAWRTRHGSYPWMRQSQSQTSK